MRQDAVMQQFFELVNSVLLQNPDTQKRKLRIATYKVICTSSTVPDARHCHTVGLCMTCGSTHAWVIQH